MDYDDAYDETMAEIRELCKEVWSYTDSRLTDLSEIDTSDDLRCNIDVLKELQARLEKYEKQLIALENSVSGCGIEPYDIAGNR